MCQHSHLNNIWRDLHGAIDACVSPKKTQLSSKPKFDFQKHCFSVVKHAILKKEKDPKHPGRWRRAVICKTVGDKSAGEIDMKQEILKKHVKQVVTNGQQKCEYEYLEQ